MAANSPILSFSGAVKRDPAVQAWLDGQPEHLRALARPWFERMRACGDDVRELMHDGCPRYVSATPASATSTRSRPTPTWGSSEAQPCQTRLVCWWEPGKLGRHVKLAPQGAVNAAALEAVITAAYRNIKASLRADLARDPV